MYSDEATALVPGARERLSRLWPYSEDGFRYKNRKSPGESVAYSTALISELYDTAGFKLLDPVRMDASYCPARTPKIREMGTHLYYAQALIAIAH